MSKIFIFGSGKQALVAANIIKNQKKYTIAAFIDKNIKIKEFFGKKIIPEKFFFLNVNKKENIIIAVGENSTRKKIYDKLKNRNFKFPNIIHKNAVISKDITIGYGNIIMPGVIINNNVKIKNFNIINTGSILEHDCKISSFTSISPGTVISGNCKIGDSVFIGSNSTLIHNITIKSNSVIGAGSVIIKNINDNSRVVGNPSREISQKKKYL
jgi:sugar O-acyltransferase (sialic acid O-acetyltransferase NeuD family)